MKLTKPNILFIISNLETGGVSKSMTSLMNVIDRERYNVSLMVTSPHGAFMELLPRGLRLITNPVWAALVSGPKGFATLIKMGKPLLAFGHLIRLMLSCIDKARAGWMIATLMPPIDEEFDTVVDFNGQHQLYFMVDKIKARKKVTFFHSDYAKWPYYYSADKKYFGKVDNIFSVSQQCVDSLKQYFPQHTEKIGLMENISSLVLIEKMAKAPIAKFDSDNALLTIGHVCENKGIYLALEAARVLRQRGLNFKWYFIGSIEDENRYNESVASKGLSKCIQFLGIRTNPYPYIRQADVIVHPSKFEGKSIALDEAKLLCKPVVATNFSTVYDQFTDRVNGSICEMNAESLANAIEELLSDKSLQQRYVDKLYATRHDNSAELTKLYTIFDS